MKEILILIIIISFTSCQNGLREKKSSLIKETLVEKDNSIKTDTLIHKSISIETWTDLINNSPENETTTFNLRNYQAFAKFPRTVIIRLSFRTSHWKILSTQTWRIMMNRHFIFKKISIQI